jgi:hypothetical protein
MSKILELYLISKLAGILTKDWTEMDAYKLGIIDRNGKFLKKSYDLKTSKERLAFSSLHRFAFNLKKLIESFPGGKSKIAKYITVWALIKEGREDLNLNETFEHRFSTLNSEFEEEFRK